MAEMGVMYRRKPVQGAGLLPLLLPASFLEAGFLTEAISSSPAGQGALGIHSSLPTSAVIARHPPRTGKPIMTGAEVGRSGENDLQKKCSFSSRWILERKITVIEISRKCQWILCLT